MLQLVYTSAPRLLEAGKTGFGTVARSRELPANLVSYLERLSSFDRSAGVAEYRFYSEYRMGGSRYRIFSRVADCGVDYTRRTNHIAHHFVVAVGDDEDVCMAGSTPAGLLQALDGAFLRTWTGNPTWLPQQLLPTDLPRHGNGSWQRACGQPAYARWLSALPKDGCYLTAPQAYTSTQWLELLHEGMLTCADHGWGLAFSTAKVSTLSSNAYPICCVDTTQLSAGVTIPGHAFTLELKQGMQAPPAPALATPAVPQPAAVATAPVPAPLAATAMTPPMPPTAINGMPLPTGWDDATSPAAPIPHPPTPHTKRSQGNTGMYVLGGCVILAAAILYVGQSPKETSPTNSTPQSRPYIPETKQDTTDTEKEKAEAKQNTTDTEKTEDKQDTTEAEKEKPETKQDTTVSPTKKTETPQETPDEQPKTPEQTTRTDSPKPEPAETKPQSPETQTPPRKENVDTPTVTEPTSPPVPTHLERTASVILLPEGNGNKKFSLDISCNITKKEIIDTFQLKPSCHLYWDDEEDKEMGASRNFSKTQTENYPDVSKQEGEINKLKKKIKKLKESNNRDKNSDNGELEAKLKNLQDQVTTLKNEVTQIKAKETREKQEEYKNTKLIITIIKRDDKCYVYTLNYEFQYSHE